MFKNNFISAVLLVNNKNEILFQLRDNKPKINLPNYWVFPGGHSKTGEDPMQTAKREFFEETNYICNSLNYLLTFNDIKHHKNPININFFWTIYDEKQNLICNEGQKICFLERSIALEKKVPSYLLQVWEMFLINKNFIFKS